MDTSSYWQLLSQDEKDRALRFKFKELQERYILFRGTLRQTLALFLDISPVNLVFAYTEHGKPYLPEHSALQFNISHAENEALIAITHGANVGIDIEKIKMLEIDKLAERFFSSVEAEYLHQQSENEKIDAFFQLWTAKEAFIKATGLGLSQNLKRFSIGLEPLQLLHAEDVDVSEWTLLALGYKAGFSGSVATRQKNCSIKWMDTE